MQYHARAKNVRSKITPTAKLMKIYSPFVKTDKFYREIIFV